MNLFLGAKPKFRSHGCGDRIALHLTQLRHASSPLRPQLRVCIDPITGLELPYTPHGRFVHVPPPNPSTKWATDFGRPWWKDPKYIIGKLSNRTRLIKITNMLSSESQTLEVWMGTDGPCSTILNSMEDG